MGKGLALVVVPLVIASCGDDGGPLDQAIPQLDGGQLDSSAGTLDHGSGTPDTGVPPPDDSGGPPPDDTGVPSPDGGGSCTPPGGKCLKHKECGAWKCLCTDGLYPVNSQWCNEGTCVVEQDACTNICGDSSKVKSAVYQGCM
jgi:hypothetical protein